jgi:glycosyltransferase involved in cell wall biosynthesis
MKILAYPADDYGCGHHRIIWPAEVLKHQGYDITYVTQQDRHVRMTFYPDGRLKDIGIPEDIDVVVFQRTTDFRVVHAIKGLRERGVAVVVDVDDDLGAVHPGNPAWTFLDPNRAEREVKLALAAGQIKRDAVPRILEQLKRRYTHSWHNLSAACKEATLVTVSTPGLLRRYAAHGRGMVVRNYAPDHYLEVAHADSDLVGWPAALHSHPNDPAAVGNGLARVVSEGARFITIGESRGVGRAFGLREEPAGGDVTLEEWPAAISKLGVGIAPLADTRFNFSKSWLKPLELSAVGVPWVASPRQSYVELHREGAGVLAEKPREWYRALRSLIDDPVRREELSLAGREVAARLRLSDNAWHHMEAWELAYRIAHNAPRDMELPRGA